MLEFEKYSLVLLKDDKIIYTSNKPGLRPILTCVKENRLKFENCILYDKVIGLAAARLIVYSDIVSSVITPVISKSAKELLIKNKIEIESGKVVKNILNKEKTKTCPMELKAKRINNDEEFFQELISIFMIT
jgi:hypothetical protein